LKEKLKSNQRRLKTSQSVTRHPLYITDLMAYIMMLVCRL